MKNTITIKSAISLFSLQVISCAGDSIERDAKKYSELQYKHQKLTAQYQIILKLCDEKGILWGHFRNGSKQKIMDEITKLVSQSKILSKEIEGKYTSESDKKKFAVALLKEMANCKG